MFPLAGAHRPREVGENPPPEGRLHRPHRAALARHVGRAEVQLARPRFGIEVLARSAAPAFGRLRGLARVVRGLRGPFAISPPRQGAEVIVNRGVEGLRVRVALAADARQLTRRRWRRGRRREVLRAGDRRVRRARGRSGERAGSPRRPRHEVAPADLRTGRAWRRTGRRDPFAHADLARELVARRVFAPLDLLDPRRPLILAPHHYTPRPMKP